MKKFALFLAGLALAILAAGCSSKGSTADWPADFKVVAGDASVIVTWTAEPDVEYWIFYGPGTGITTTNWTTTGGAVVPKVTSPRVISGLTNGNTYSFTINGRKNGGPGGSGAPTQTVVPVLAGANWSVGAPLSGANLNGVSAGFVATGAAVVAVGANGTIFTSINGVTTTPTNPAPTADLNAIWYSTIGFLAAGTNGTILYSVDALTWTAQTSGTTAALRGGTSTGTGGFIAVGDGGTILYTVDGTSWLALDSGTTNRLNAATYGGGRFVVVGAGGTIVTTSDGVTYQSAASGTTNDLLGVTYAALSSTATDGSTVVTNNYVAVGAAGTVLTSSDGLTWALRAPLSSNDVAAVVYGGQFVAVGKGGGIFTSTDAITWQARNSGTTNDLNAVVRTLSGYTTVGKAGTNVSSF